jgi:hypothetical protein
MPYRAPQRTEIAAARISPMEQGVVYLTMAGLLAISRLVPRV